jgi:hypothetical protein
MAIGKGIGGYVFHSQGKAAFHLHSYHSLNFMQHFPRMQSTASRISCPIS